jgi:hypothetical protein
MGIVPADSESGRFQGKRVGAYSPIWREQPRAGAFWRIASVEILPLGLSDEEAIARAHTVSAKRKGHSRASRFRIAPALFSGIPGPPKRL